jgi:alpha-tubulin suppressor-like RCC1 family protein
VLLFAFVLGGCQYVLGVDFLDDPKLASGDATPDCHAMNTCLQLTNTGTPCVPGEPDCTNTNDGGLRGGAGSTHLRNIASGSQHVCAIVGADVKCFGENGEGELGTDSTKTSSEGLKVLNLENIRSLAAGSFHTCALLETGTVKCWGDNSFGQLGDGTLETRLVPVDVPNLANVVALAAGSAHTCALLAGGPVKCWGANDQGQLGNNSVTPSSVPIDIGLIATSIASGIGAQHTCASTETGIKCWGANQQGQLGIGTTQLSIVPHDVAGIGPGVITAGITHTCALTANGAFCWGQNRMGELGSNVDGIAVRPTPVPGVGVDSGATDLACGTHHCCAALKTGVLCWGHNDGGQLGTATPNATASGPVKVDGDLGAVRAVTAGERYSCAQSDKGISCWGADPGLSDTSFGPKALVVPGMTP